MIDRPLRVVVLGRSIYGLHGVGGLERPLYELVRHHLADGWHVTLITRTPRTDDGVDPDAWREVADHPRCDVRSVPYRTFPFGGTRAARRSSIAARRIRGSDNAPAGRGATLVAAGTSTSCTASAPAGAVTRSAQTAGGRRAPLVLNPHGLEEFGDIDGSVRRSSAARALAYAPLRRVVRATARRRAVIAIDAATDQAVVPAILRRLPVDSLAFT